MIHDVLLILRFFISYYGWIIVSFIMVLCAWYRVLLIIFLSDLWFDELIIVTRLMTILCVILVVEYDCTYEISSEYSELYVPFEDLVDTLFLMLLFIICIMVWKYILLSHA